MFDKASPIAASSERHSSEFIALCQRRHAEKMLLTLLITSSAAMRSTHRPVRRDGDPDPSGRSSACDRPPAMIVRAAGCGAHHRKTALTGGNARSNSAGASGLARPQGIHARRGNAQRSTPRPTCRTRPTNGRSRNRASPLMEALGLRDSAALIYRATDPHTARRGRLSHVPRAFLSPMSLQALTRLNRAKNHIVASDASRPRCPRPSLRTTRSPRELNTRGWSSRGPLLLAGQRARAARHVVRRRARQVTALVGPQAAASHGAHRCCAYEWRRRHHYRRTKPRTCHAVARQQIA